MLIDIIYLLLILMAFIKGIRKGFILALFSVIALIVGLAAALKLSAVVATKLSATVNLHEKWLPLIAFMLVFMLVIILITLGGRLIQKTFEIATLGWLNRLAGAALYIIIYSIAYSVLLFYAVQLHLVKKEAVAASAVYPHLHVLAPYIINEIGGFIPFFKGIFSQLEQFFEDVSNKITII